MKLRKLTEKSTLGFGKYHDYPVWKLLEKSSTRRYLTWVYFNCSHIDFFDDIIEKLRIRTDEKINKPGKDTKLGEYITQKFVKAQLYHNIQAGDKWVYAFIRKNQKNKVKGQLNLIKESKGSLARKNQGHKK